MNYTVQYAFDGEDFDDFETTWNPDGGDHFEYIAQDICSHAWDHHDGWEWMQNSDDKLRVRFGDIEKEFSFNVEFEPTFNVSSA